METFHQPFYQYVWKACCARSWSKFHPNFYYGNMPDLETPESSPFGSAPCLAWPLHCRVVELLMSCIVKSPHFRVYLDSVALVNNFISKYVYGICNMSCNLLRCRLDNLWLEDLFQRPNLRLRDLLMIAQVWSMHHAYTGDPIRFEIGLCTMPKHSNLTRKIYLVSISIHDRFQPYYRVQLNSINLY